MTVLQFSKIQNKNSLNLKKKNEEKSKLKYAIQSLIKTKQINRENLIAWQKNQYSTK